jgi:hypothetical protein
MMLAPVVAAALPATALLPLREGARGDRGRGRLRRLGEAVDLPEFLPPAAVGPEN